MPARTLTLRRRPFRHKPTWIPRIGNNWLSSGLVFCAPFTEGAGAPRDVVSGAQASTFGSDITWETGPRGRRLNFGGTSPNNQLIWTFPAGNDIMTLDNDMTVLFAGMTFAALGTDQTGMWLEPNQVGAGPEDLTDNALFIWNTTTTSGQMIYIHESGAGVNDQQTFSSIVTANQLTNFALTRDSVQSLVFGQRGDYPTADLGSAFNYTNQPASTGDIEIAIGERTSNIFTFEGTLEMVAIWQRVFAADELSAIINDPYVLFDDEVKASASFLVPKGFGTSSAAPVQAEGVVSNSPFLIFS